MKSYALFFGLLLVVASAGRSDDRAENEIRLAQEADAKIVDSLFVGVGSIELFALDPYSNWERDEVRAKDKRELLGAWRVTGKAMLNDPKKIGRLRAALLAGIRENKGTIAMCFNPRHALRFRRDGSEITFIICFECEQATITGTTASKGFSTSHSPDPIFDKVFSSLGLKRTE